MSDKDIFKSGFTIPNDTIVVVGSGPNGLENYHKIPDDAYVIACNMAIKIPDVKFDAWCVVDANCFDKQYFKDALENFEGVRFFLHDFPEEMLDRPNTFTVDHEKGLSRKIDKFFPEYGQIKAGGTVATTALQVAFWFGRCSYMSWEKEGVIHGPSSSGLTKEQFIKWYSLDSDKPKIRVIGVDMKGKDYFDGTFSKIRTLRNGVWVNHTPIINAVVQWMIEQGVDIKSYSKTIIDVEVVAK